MSTNFQQIEEVGFSLFSPNEVRKLGETQITEFKLDFKADSVEAENSLKSLRLGPLELAKKCPRCTLQVPDCPGHFGYIEFPQRSNGRKVYILHPELMSTIFRTLQCCCQRCGNPLLTAHEVETLGFNRLRGSKKLDAIAKESIKRDACRVVLKGPQGDIVCGTPNPIYYLGKDKDRGNFIRYHARGEKKVDPKDMAKLEPETIKEIFFMLGVEPKSVQLLGFAPNIIPEYMIMENILVLPTSYRPPRIVAGRETHNDLTNVYVDIIRACNAIGKHDLSSDEEEKYIGLLFTYIATLFNNSTGSYHYAGNGRPHRTIKCLITGKGRLIRGYTQGKRVNYCMRTVASPNPRIRLRQVGIPASLAKLVTYPEWANELNTTRLQRYLDEGKVVSLIKARGPFKGRMIGAEKITERTKQAWKVELGDQVDRWIMGPRTEDGTFFEGDYVLVNRQPTLQKPSMMGMEAVIVNEETFQMSVNVCGPFGLDFDGDELNIHVPQTPEAQAEIRGRMTVTQNIISAQNNRPIVGPTLETVSHLYLLTRDGVIISRAEFQQIVTATFSDLSTGEITSRVESLMERIHNARKTKLTIEGVPVHQHRIDNAVVTKLAQLAPGELETRARGILTERYWRQKYTQDDDSKEPYTAWLFRQFTHKPQELDVLSGKPEAARRSREYERQEHITSLRKQLKEHPGDAKVITKEIQQYQQESEHDRESKEEEKERLVLEDQFQAWYTTNAQIREREVPIIVEDLVRQAETKRHYVTGRELISLLYPMDYFYSKRNDVDPLEPVVHIESGVQVSGQHDKSTLGATHGSIVADLFKFYSPDAAEDFITRSKWLADSWGRLQGLSVSLESCLTTDPNFTALLQDRIKTAKIDTFILGPRSANALEESHRQELIREKLCNLKSSSGKLALQRSDPNNALNIMALSGAKGSKENISSIMTMVGQQEFQGQPIPSLPSGRSVPFFERNTREPEAQGFVAHNYLDGMTPAEFYLHQYAAREGLFGTALKTSDTGYMQRRILKVLEDAKVYPDGTVRNAQGIIIQYAYGEDGFSGDRLVMKQNKSRFIDPKRLLSIIQERRKKGLPKLYQPETENQRPVYVMPSFERQQYLTLPEENEEEEDEEKKEEEEEPEEELGSDLSDADIGEEED